MHSYIGIAFMNTKKSLGQNFLKSKEAIREIVKSAYVSDGETILEVGPGKGVLTRAILDAGARVIAVEKDDRLTGFLSERFSGELSLGRLVIVNGDILKKEPSELGLERGKYKIVANIPYYITGSFLRKFLSSPLHPSVMVLMLQKEVAKRIVASDRKESILSISVKSYGSPKYVLSVPRKYFSPEPNVDSAIVLIDHINKDFFTDSGLDENDFFKLVKKSFSQKRKKLANNLPCDKSKSAKILSEMGMDKDIRAENVSLDGWKRIALALRNDIIA
ncbi:MAG: ribosomal RNA small subunit methyltransferase A [Candidatus Taylorbacteria bacterium RIFCSPLOWO2_12_FULL_43_20]|uniref:Ribosomal RNA small subunit methyltransferase A n=1 Tax=Candidatus Taylorbacteria bacterium RIFCSPLOWO2_12_FULL_43_20 TaxID=1802332 RepID=A0A1G2P2V9_9BACT|nr:MAG: ribosomal RNA small subunit methyltransferase A [Candidatus Taylorbacteria bacterium RIFCSPHIGHO2_01_FULL_43_120]OHA22571.1 MAG: ribosomal RNA small subunit methyltransferase A [Candidatus Taylorbacteria bacterium RIFCSPHIGHO2_02_FULL_43_55]OHA28605.1 MAG: ribosomal RNA small subunit methyltransferase A [Candidatus Taylorbacteria bacterium RIFCSPHIGHO2_12_FULL_42_34]OHA30519.1 MAG: ribosomal RNA small subunit methyltransferase A [Candidatus Taylorbacteria bacterium RIFCSPLOWO2_01_FULL_43